MKKIKKLGKILALVPALLVFGVPFLIGWYMVWSICEMADIANQYTKWRLRR